MKRFLNSDWKIILSFFLLWKVFILIAVFMAVSFLPLAGSNFLGGGFEKYISNPYFWGWANFDGEHYLSIAQIGYKNLEQAFFPVYPTLMRIFSAPFEGNISSLVIVGLLISNVAFFTALIFLYKLLKLDFSQNISLLTIVVMLVFPTSFYFGAVYSESLFLLFSVLSFYLIRKNHFFLGSLFGVFASATRIFGILLLPALMLDLGKRKISYKSAFWIFFIPLGLLFYMFYQWVSVSDPLAFYHLQKLVGPQHESGLTLLPQVYFRYIKILTSVDLSNPIYQTIILEFFTGLAFFVLPIYGYFKKVNLAYVFFALIGFLLPTIQGSFSSVPRYVIVLFPSFLCLAIFLKGFSKLTQITVVLLSIIWLGFETILFFRGYWVA